MVKVSKKTFELAKKLGFKNKQKEVPTKYYVHLIDSDYEMMNKIFDKNIKK